MNVDSITGQVRAQTNCDFRFGQIEKKSKVAVLQLSQAGPGKSVPVWLGELTRLT